MPIAHAARKSNFRASAAAALLSILMLLGLTACDEGGGGESGTGAGGKTRGNVIHTQQLEARGATYDVWVSHDQNVLTAGAQKQGSKGRSIHTFATTDAGLAGTTGMPLASDTSNVSITLLPPGTAQVTVGGVTTTVQLK